MRLLRAEYTPVAVFSVAVILITAGVIGRRTDRATDETRGRGALWVVGSAHLASMKPTAERFRKLARVRESSELNKALFDGYIRPGDSLADVLANYPGGEVAVYGCVTHVWYFGNDHYYAPSLIARDGRLVFADVNCVSSLMSRFDRHVIFDLMTFDDHAELKSGRRAEYQRRLDRLAALRAVAGMPVTFTWQAEWLMQAW